MFAEKDLFVAPHSDVQWSEFSKYISDYKLGDYYPRDDIESNKYASINGNNNGNNGNNGKHQEQVNTFRNMQKLVAKNNRHQNPNR